MAKKPEVDESEYEMVSAGTRFGAAPKLNSEWTPVPEVLTEGGKKAAFWASQITAADVAEMVKERRLYDEHGRFIGIDDARDGQRRLAWALRDKEVGGKRSFADTDTALAAIGVWPEHVVNRLLDVLDSLGRPAGDNEDEPGKDSGTTPTE